MLSATAPFLDAALEPFRSRWIVAQPVEAPSLCAAYFALRRQVFVVEQGLFSQHDLDAHDLDALHIAALTTCAGVPDDLVGVVRIYPERSDAQCVWFGGRLGVARPFRRTAEVGASLIRAAVGAARGLGASRFLATVQRDNVAYFERYHFSVLEPVTVCGRPHCLMEAELGAFAVPHWLRESSTLVHAQAALAYVDRSAWTRAEP